ncbi:MAG: hypothetical protein H0X31_00025 [Nostocaceae cyanobacterium]|nr:hypothetical protein [Nostocaceae cyanobacterium]
MKNCRICYWCAIASEDSDLNLLVSGRTTGRATPQDEQSGRGTTKSPHRRSAWGICGVMGDFGLVLELMALLVVCKFTAYLRFMYKGAIPQYTPFFEKLLTTAV